MATRYNLISVRQMLFHQLLRQLVPIETADQRTGVVVVGDIGGVLGENIAHDLVDGIVTPSPAGSCRQT